MIIKGIQKTTLIDFPGHIAATVFTAGCNFRCVFCHNSLLVEDSELPTIPEAEVLEYLRGRTHQLEGVCISGGEPTLHNDLPKFIRELKSMGYAVKLDTNGTNPEMLEQLFSEKLLDYVAMDIKGPLALYPQIVNTEVDQDKIVKSIELVKNSGVKYEFRTTVMPVFHGKENVAQLGCMLRGAKTFYLQQFQGGEFILNKAYANSPAYTAKELEDIAKELEPYVEKVGLRGVA